LACCSSVVFPRLTRGRLASIVGLVSCTNICVAGVVTERPLEKGPTCMPGLEIHQFPERVCWGCLSMDFVGDCSYTSQCNHSSSSVVEEPLFNTHNETLSRWIVWCSCSTNPHASVMIVGAGLVGVSSPLAIQLTVVWGLVLPIGRAEERHG
jgi:hypothetical protein